MRFAADAHIPLSTRICLIGSFHIREAFTLNRGIRQRSHTPVHQDLRSFAVIIIREAFTLNV